MRYHILGRNNLARTELPLRNEIFSAWNDLWNTTYKSVDPQYKLKTEEFERQDLVTCIMIDDRVAAAHLYTFYHLDSLACQGTHYFDFFSESYFQTLRGRQVRTLMSMEYLTVMPDFRKSRVGFSLGSTLVQLGTYVWERADADAIVAPARNDVKVNEMTYDVGFRCIEKDTTQRGFVCDLVACFRGEAKPSPVTAVREAADCLWAGKSVHDSASLYFPAETTAGTKAA